MINTGDKRLDLRTFADKGAYNLEGKIQEQIVKALGALGVHVIRSAMHRRTSNQKGTPDLLFAYRGIPYAIEVKRPGGKVRPEQEETLRALSRNGWRVAVLDDVQAAITFVQTQTQS